MGDPQLTSLTKKYSDLTTPYDSTICAEYVWIENITSPKLLSKTRNLNSVDWYRRVLYTAANIPKWICNINENTGYLHPAVQFEDPFRLGNSFLTLCESYLANDEPTAFTKNRKECQNTSDENRVHDHIFKIEQEFTFHGQFDATINISQKDSARKVVECFFKACVYAGLSISDFAIENHPQDSFSYTIGPANGLHISDELWMSRYILQRVAEEFHLAPCFGPPIHASTHYVFSTFNTREVNKEDARHQAELCIEKLRSGFNQNMRANSGYDNGEGPAALNFSLRTEDDRISCVVETRPNSDPYVVTKAIITSTSAN